ncbi:MAG: extracellular solute-binding protein [Clostridia bacterium]|nr:extracellular solute-binding protein [Clostridia bacterium]
MKKTIVWMLALCLLCGNAAYAATTEATEPNTQTQLPETEQSVSSLPLMSAYLAQHAQAARPEQAITVDVLAPTTYEGDAPVVQTTDGREALITAADGSVTWSFTVPETGLYTVTASYYPLEGKGNTIERALYLDGALPYSEARAVVFNRVWVNDGKDKLYSASGNEFRRPQTEAPAWQTAPLISGAGYGDDALQLYLTAGEHTLTLADASEPLALSALTFCQLKQTSGYAEVLAGWKAEGAKEVEADVKPIILQGEDADRKSSSVLYAVEDRTSCITQPFDEAKILLNTIGGNGWAAKHQWLEWDVTVPETGLYRFDLRCKQDFVSGGTAFRTLTVDGEIPFAEAENMAVSFDLQWQVTTLGGAEEPCLLYLTEGTHTLRMTVSQNDEMSAVLEDVSAAIQELNALCRKIRTITGSFPDTYRDYNLEGNIPDMYDTIRTNIQRLEAAEARMVGLSGEKGEQSVYIDTVLVSLNAFLDDPDSIPERISTLSDNLNSLASWMASASQVPLLIDYVSLSSAASALPKAKAGFFENLSSTIRAFFISFVSDYYSIEGVTDASQVTRNVTLWMASGRDQAMVIKTLADGSFTPNTGIGLEVRLVADDVLMRAVASGAGPDVAVFQGQARPVEYGLRGALKNLNEFPDVKEITARFAESAMVSQSFGDALYGLPEQQHFMMMFYRTDVLEELGLKAPNTWDELYDMIPILQENGLDVGFPSPTGVQSGSISTDLNAMFSAYLLQSGGQVYTENGYSALGSLEAVDAFIRWSELYTKYNAAKTYSPINRFRTGESPVLMTSYTFYNTLVVAAPEIDGLWSMMPLPGTVKADGTVDRTAASTITSVLQFKNAKDEDAAWEFLKWWTSTEAQIGYAEEIEAIQGESARWPTANLEAMKQISWKRSIAGQISEQWKWVVGIPEVPGSYYVGRTVDNAIKSVINSGASPRDTILDAVDSINEEIRKKRQEFGLE